MSEKLKFSIIDGIKANVPDSVEKTVSGKEFVYWGENNDMPEVYLECYDKCSTLGSIIDGMVDYVCGAGIEQGETVENNIVNKKDVTLLELIKKCVTDYIIYNSFAVEVLRNPYGQAVDFNWIDMRKIRLDEDGDFVYYNKAWNKYARSIKKIQRYSKNDKTSKSIFVFNNPKTRGIYSKPMWSSALRDALTLIEISKYNHSEVINHFNCNTVISFNNGQPDDETADKIENLINKKFSGADNASRIMLTFSDSRDNAPEISKMGDDSAPERYLNLYQNAVNALFVAFRCSPQLMGLDPQKTGFNSVEFSNAFKLFRTTVIKPIAKDIEKAFGQLGFNFNLKQFEIIFDDNNDTNTTPENEE